MNLAKEGKSDSEYTFLNFWNFPEGLGLKVKGGEYSPRAPRGQELSLSEEVIEWATGITEMCGTQSQLLTPHMNNQNLVGILCPLRAS